MFAHCAAYAVSTYFGKLAPLQLGSNCLLATLLVMLLALLNELTDSPKSRQKGNRLPVISKIVYLNRRSYTNVLGKTKNLKKSKREVELPKGASQN